MTPRESKIERSTHQLSSTRKKQIRIVTESERSSGTHLLPTI